MLCTCPRWDDPMSTGNPMSRPVGEKCPATSKQTKGPCGQAAGHGTDHVGFGLCKWHGGLSPGGKVQAERLEQAWRERLEREIDPSLDTVVGIRDDTTVDPRVRGAMAKDLLDRAGVKVSPDETDINIDITIEWPE